MQWLLERHDQFDRPFCHQLVENLFGNRFKLRAANVFREAVIPTWLTFVPLGIQPHIQAVRMMRFAHAGDSNVLLTAGDEEGARWIRQVVKTGTIVVAGSKKQLLSRELVKVVSVEHGNLWLIRG